ncbi:hypothetical protein ACFL20_09595 [Spirochaetota bacterium]
MNGIICHDKPVVWETQEYIDDELITKTHDVDIDRWIENYSNIYNLFFICSERDEKYDLKYYNYDNVLIINYSDLLETDNNSLENIINNIYAKLYDFLPKIFFPDIKEKAIKNAIERIQKMNQLYETIKDKPFSYVNTFYHLHGSHRNRN